MEFRGDFLDVRCHMLSGRPERFRSRHATYLDLKSNEKYKNCKSVEMVSDSHSACERKWWVPNGSSNRSEESDDLCFNLRGIVSLRVSLGVPGLNFRLETEIWAAIYL